MLQCSNSVPIPNPHPLDTPESTMLNNEQFAAAQKAQLATLMGLTATGIEATEKLRAEHRHGQGRARRSPGEGRIRLLRQGRAVVLRAAG
jgi:hypothetical protein